MTFKIVKTYNEKRQREELCICPSAWEKNNVLFWPNKKGTKLSKLENSVPQPGWLQISCVVKRKKIQSYELADQLLNDMTECSTTEQDQAQEIILPVATGTQRTIQDFNQMAEQATAPADLADPDDIIAHAPEAEENKKEETVYTISLNGNEALFSNQIEIFNNQKIILNNQSELKKTCSKVLENQNNLMLALANVSVQLETVMTKINNPVVSKLSENMKKSAENSPLLLQPIRTLTELSHLEDLLNDSHIKEDYKLKYSIVCQPGKAMDCAYRLVDVFFSRDFLTQCSWSGSTRGTGAKICLKLYRNVLNLFFELVFDCDNSYTIVGNDNFFKSILKNSTKRKNSKLQRASTSRRSAKRQKLPGVNVSEQAVEEGSEEDLVANVPEQRRAENDINAPEQRRAENDINAPEHRGAENDINAPEQRGAENDINAPEQRGAENDINAPEQRRAENDINAPEQRGAD